MYVKYTGPLKQGVNILWKVKNILFPYNEVVNVLDELGKKLTETRKDEFKECKPEPKKVEQPDKKDGGK